MVLEGQQQPLPLLLLQLRRQRLLHGRLEEVLEVQVGVLVIHLAWDMVVVQEDPGVVVHISNIINNRVVTSHHHCSINNKDLLHLGVVLMVVVVEIVLHNTNSNNTTAHQLLEEEALRRLYLTAVDRAHQIASMEVVVDHLMGVGVHRCHLDLLLQ